jgi:serine/threonine protein kinase
MAFALELYNLSSTWHDGKDTKLQVNKLDLAVENISVSRKLESFNSKSKRPATDTGGDDRPSNKSKTGDAARQLEDSGYEVVPDVLETDGGTWELIDKVQHRNHFSIPDIALTIVLQPPPHVRIVYRLRDPNKTEYVAKHLREGSNELAIHEYLQTIPLQSPHIISFIEAVPSTTREWLILPKLHSIADQWFLDENRAAGRVQLGWGLVKGLAYLHEHEVAHRDIKPGNLVCDDDFNLKIIDYDIAIKVRDENTLIDEYCGTEGWTAPEIGKQQRPRAMYSPIRADRWSCGRVILRHIMVGIMAEKEDHRLLKFADQLMAKDPLQRPSLLGWHKLLAPPPPNVVHDRYQQAVGESVKPPNANAKKRKLELEPESVQLQASPLMGKVF